jgi:hypothetical protein
MTQQIKAEQTRYITEEEAAYIQVVSKKLRLIVEADFPELGPDRYPIAPGGFNYAVRATIQAMNEVDIPMPVDQRDLSKPVRRLMLRTYVIGMVIILGILSLFLCAVFFGGVV